MQSRLGLLVHFTKLKEKLGNVFNDLKVTNGPSMTAFLGNITCTSTKRTCVDITDYLTSNVVHYHGIKLIEDNNNIPKLPDIRTQFLDALIEGINAYFPDSNALNFEVFHPKNIPTSDQEDIIISYGITEVYGFCRYFQWGDCEDLIIEWTNLLYSIAELENNNCALRTANVVQFWSKLLDMPEIRWTTKTKLLIHTILVIPVGSADAERGFSIMNHIRTKRRSSLDQKFLSI